MSREGTRVRASADVIPLRMPSVRSFLDAYGDMLRNLAVAVLTVPLPPPGSEKVWFILTANDFKRPPVTGRRVSVRQDLQYAVVLLIVGMRTNGFRTSVRRLSRRSKTYAVFIRAPT